MSCILKITDPLLKSILGKGEFKTIDELRVTFDDVANKHSILPLNINPPSKGFDIQKFGKVYKEGNEIKVQIVLPGQEYFSQFNLSSRLPEEMREVSFYGDTDDKTLTFDSLDSFLGFYLANFLYVTDTNYTKLAKGVTTILENVVGRLQGKTFKHAGAIEDLLFADSLVNYSKLLYNHAGLEEPPVINQVYELIKDKWDRYHKNEVDHSRVKEKAEQNVQTFVKSDVRANLFFQAFDYVNGKENTKPLAQARRNLIRAIQDPSLYSVKLVQGSVTQAQQTDDKDVYPSVKDIEQGVVGILIDENGNQLYLNKNNELTPNREEAISIDYEVEGEKKSSPEITLPFLNVHKPLKEEFLKASPQQRETYIFKVENTKTQIEEQTFEEFSKVGRVEDILINIIADDPYAGISYLMKDGKQIIVDSTPLNEEEIQEVVELLEHTYEPDVLEKVVAYLNDLISVSDERVKKEKTGKEIAFFPAVDRIWVMPLRIKEGDTFQSVESDPIDITEDKELILKSLRAARVRFRKGEGASLSTSWSKWKIVDGVPKSFSVKREEGIKFYENHIKKVKVDQKTSSQIATFNQRALPTKDKEKEVVIGLLKVVKGKSYTIGQINQLVSPTFLEPEKTIWTTVYNNSKVTPRFVFDDYPESFPAYYDRNTNQIIVKYSQLLINIQNEPAFLGRALTEELLHAITIPLLNQYKDTIEYQRLQEDYEKAKELAKTYKDTDNYNKLGAGQKEKMDKVVNYYLQSFEEFVVGVSHPYFRSFLTLGKSRGLLEDIIDKVKKLLNKILKDVAPSLYTDVTTDLFNFIAKKPSELTPLVIEQTQISTAPEIPEVPLKKRQKKSTESKEIKKYYTIPTIPEDSEIDLTLVQGIDAEIGKTLFSNGRFADFVQKNVETESVWQRMVNDLKEEYNELVDAPSTQENEERLDWIDLFLEKENEIKRQWIEKSNLFLFNNDKIVINEDEIGLEDEESAETFEEMESKDPGFNKVDSEQKYTRLQLGDPYAKILVKLTPVGRVKGLTKLADFTNLWNRLQNLLANTISFDEQIKILSNTDNLVIVPEAPILIERLTKIPKDVNGAIIINNFQRSFGTAQLPVYNTYFTKTDKGYDYSFFESAKLDVQNLEMLINQGFNEFAEKWKTTVRLGDREIPTYDLKQFLTFLEKSKDLVETYRQLGFPIPVMDKDRFIREAGLTNFHAGLIQIIKNRIGKWNGGESKNTVILNGDLLTFIKSPATWEEFGGGMGQSPGLATLTNKFTSVLAKYSPLTVSNMTKNAENQNQSILLSWSSWLISIKQLNNKKYYGESYRSKNPIFKYSLLAQLVSSDNQIIPINLTGQRIQDGTGWDGTVSMSQNFIDYARQEISNMILSGTGEILRAETKQSSFGYRFKWANSIHPIKLENFKTDKWISDVSDIYIGNKNEDILKGYLKGELERIEIEKNNPVIYYPKYEKIKGDFHLFTFLSKELRENLTSLSPQEAVDKYRNEIKKELINHFNNLVTELKQEVFNQTGIPLTANHPILNVVQIQEQIKKFGVNNFDNFLRAFVVNRDIYQIEHFITGHGDVGQHDKPYKRFGSNISTGTPSELNEITKQVLENTKHKQFKERIPTGRSFVISDDIFSYDNPKLVDDIEKSLTESYKRFGLDKTPKEIRAEAIKKATPYRLDPTDKRAKGINVADGQGFMTPDFGRLVMIATGTWTHDREKGFWFQKIQHKRNKGIPLEAREQEHYDKINQEIKERGIFWFFPPLKMQYRGEFIPNNETNVAIEGLDKFSLAWLWPDEMEGRVFEPILNKMMDEGYDYGKFESGTKIGTFKPDNLLQEIRNGNLNVTIESGHDIDLTYMKEQVRASDKWKNQMPMSTQARKLVLSNLRFNGEYLNKSIGEAATDWKQSQAEISEENVLDLMDRISTNGEIDNKKLADEIKEELKKRELPQSLTSIFTLYGDEFYQRFEQSLSPQLVETLIYSLLKNKVVRPKFPGEQYIMMSSSLYDREGRELGFYELGNNVIKHGVDFVFEQNPELNSIGTKEDYSQYINTIFPNSKVKDIVYHGSDSKKEKFSNIGAGTHFGTLKSAKERRNKSIIPVILNINNPILFKDILDDDVLKASDEFLKENGEYLEHGYRNEESGLLVYLYNQDKIDSNTLWDGLYSDRNTMMQILQNALGSNGYRYINEVEDKGNTSYVVFEPEQIYILGSKQDVSGFKKWKQSLPQVVETTKPAQCKVVLSGEFLKLLNVEEIQNHINKPEVKSIYDNLSPYEQIENKRELLNQLLLNPVFVEKYKDSLTVFSSRIPGQGYNSMDIMTIQEFLPTYMGAVLVPYAQMTTKVGADFDFDKIPTITPELTKTGKAKKSKVNRMLNAASRLILDPINFHRLVTPNTTDEIDQVVTNTLEALGENVSEPKFDKIFSFTTHLRKWMATKMKDALGIGATNNTFYTLLQDSDSKLNTQFSITEDLTVDVKFPFDRDEQAMSYPLLQSGIDKLEFVNEFINITVDVASNDAIGYTGLKRDNSALLLFLLENGVDFKDAFYFINQPIIIKYHQLLNQFKDQGKTTGESKNLAISKLLGIITEENGNTISKSIIYDQIDQKITKEKFSNLLSTIARKDEVDKKWNTANQKEYLAYYLIGLEMANKMREAQTYNNFDTRPSPNLLYSQARENTFNQIRDSGLFDLEGIQKIHNDSVISHLNVHDEFDLISKVAFPIKRGSEFIKTSLSDSDFIYDQKDKENFFKKFDNDYLLAILQNYGTISKDKVEKNLTGELVTKWNKIKKLDEVKDLTITKYVVTNYSTKTPYTSLTLFLGLDGDSLTLDQIAKDLRVMLNSSNKEVKEFAKDFIETGLYTTGFTQSPVYYLKALPFEVVNGYLKEAYDNYEKLSPLEQQRFIGLFAGRFMFQRGMQFGQYWLKDYKEKFGIRNLDFATKQLKFNQEAWRYTDYKLSLEKPQQTEEEQKNCDLDIPF